MKILVADDEALVRIGLKTVLEGCNKDYEVIEAEDGCEAFDKFKEFNPSLVFVDINMPKMDGLQFVNEAKKCNKNSRFVILTCYSDFKYMREAIKIGLNDYIIKTSINDKELINIAAETEKEIAVESAGPEEQGISSGYRGIIFENEFKKAIDKKSYDKAFIEAFLKEKDIGLYFDVLIAAEKGYFHNEEPMEGAIANLIQELIKEYGSGFVFEYTEREYIIVKCSCNSGRPENTKNITEEFCNRLISCLKKFLNKDFSIGIYTGADLNCISRAVRDAQSMLQLGFFKNGPGYYFYKDGPLFSMEDIYFDALKQKIESTLKMSEYSGIIKLLDDFVAGLEGNRKYQIEKVIDVFFKVFYLIDWHIESHYPAKKPEIMDRNIDCTQFLKCGDIFHIAEIIKEVIYKLSLVSAGMQDGYYADIIKKAKDYINQNVDKKITLQGVANYVNLSHSHFSKIFKDTTGDNFIDYCIKVRMEKAKSLINEGSKVFVAAENVGYNNYSYFSKLFKKIEGITPEEYKKR